MWLLKRTAASPGLYGRVRWRIAGALRLKRGLGQILAQKMDIRREREGWRVVAEPDLYLLCVEAALEEVRGARVAQRVEPGPSDTCPARSGLEPPPVQIRGVEEAARAGGEDERRATTSLLP